MQRNARKRRRQLCSKCGQSFACSWINQHRQTCYATNSAGESESTCTGDNGCLETQATEISNSTATVFVDKQDQETGKRQDEPTAIGVTIPRRMSNLFRSRLQQRRYEREDEDFFEHLEPEESVVSEDNAETPVEPPTESWDDAEEDVLDFTSASSGPSAPDSSPEQCTDFDKQLSKLEVLALWLMLFLSSWQSQYAITDTALAVLVKFVFQFFWFLGMSDNSMAAFSKLLPKSHYKLKKALGIADDDFYKYVVCPKCKSLYNYEDCLEIRSGNKVSAKCKFVPWPNHPHRSRRGPCGEFLLKAVRSRNKTAFYPRMVYPYNSLTKSLQTLLKRPGFWSKCQEWREKTTPENIMSDVHHGKLWKELSSTGFLSHINSLALSLNVDWFQPHKHTPGSIGVLYMVILNLPREERYKLENVIVVGILPGPTEPKLTANTFLEPLVNELKLLWKGREKFSVYNCFFQKHIKVALICVTCDIPASRKIGGFMGHMANQGCSRCKKEFYHEGHLNFSGFNRDLWPPRKSDEHKKLARDTLHETSATSQQSKCSEYGARYSVLHELEYFDCIRFFVIDPMHNLYLGTAKHMMKNIWLNEECPLLSDEDFKKMQSIVDSMITPQDIGRIPGKIAHSFGGFTADQWQNWTLVYSMYALQDILPKDHLDCWRLFVNACKKLGKKVVTCEDIELGDQYLIEFLKNIEELYGPSAVTPNMHLHGHLKECMYDFGPFHGFWCFSFERYNGILGKYNTNNRSIEIQIMRKFLSQIKSKVFEFPKMYRESFQDFFEDKESTGSLKSTLDPVHLLHAFNRHQNISVNELDEAEWNDFSFVQPLPPIQDFTLDNDDIDNLKIVYSKLVGIENVDRLDIPFTVGKYSCIKIGSILYGSLSSRTIRNSYVLARWAGNFGRICDEMLRPGEVLQFFRQTIKVKSLDVSVPDQVYTFHLARVNWYSKHPNQMTLGDPLQIWCTDFDSFGPACFIPIQRIAARFVATEGHFQGEKVMIVTSLPGEG